MVLPPDNAFEFDRIFNPFELEGFPLTIFNCFSPETASSFAYEDMAVYKTEPSVWTDEEISTIRRILHELTATRILNSNDAEDIVQDTLLTMVSKRSQVVLEKGPLAWGMGILRNKVGNYYRKDRRRSIYQKTDMRVKSALPNTKSVSPEMELRCRELQKIIDSALAKLPNTQRQAMELLIAGLNPSEIVSYLEPERYQSIINRLYRGRREIVRELARYGYGANVKIGMRRAKLCHDSMYPPENGISKDDSQTVTPE